MLLWLLLILAPGRQSAGALPKALLLLKPPWSTAFKGETVTLFCKDHHSLAWEYVSWYHNETPLRKQSGKLQISKSGHYRCKTQRSSLSDPVHVQFLSDWLVLQASHPAFERDKVVLRCRGKKEEDIMERTYYKNEEKIRSSYNSNITVYPAFNDDSTYHCTASGTYIWGGSWTETSRPLKIQVQGNGYTPMGNRAWQGTSVWDGRGVLSGGDFMSGLFRAAVGGRQEVAPPAWVPTSDPEDTGPPLQELRASLPQELHLFVSLELFPSPVLIASPSWPIEGSPMTLTCETWLPPQTSHTRLQFCFFKEHQALGAGWSNSPELQIPTTWSEGAASYWCQARTVIPRILKTSPRSQIRVHRVPVSDVNLETQPPVGQLIEGEDLVLICSVAAGTGTVTFSWHREGSERSLGRKTQNALSAELRIASVREQDAGRYYCAADNLDGPVLSKRIRITLRVPVSPPVLTIRRPRSQAVEGDVVELHCEAQRGSPPILYRFYHEDVPLGNSSAPSGGEASLNLSLTAEHSGNYSCEANNSLGVQRSKMVSLSITVPVSHPVLTLNPDVAQAMVGDVLELRCEAQRGSPPILYWFYHEDVILGNTSAPFGGGASFNLSLTTEHSGNYSCGADNGLGAQSSETVSLNITGLSKNKVTHITVGVIGCLLSMLGLAATAALVGRFRTQRKSGAIPRNIGSVPGPDPPAQALHGPPSLSQPALMELQPLYSNAHSPRTHQKGEVFHQEPAIIYSEVKRADPDDPARQDREEAAEGYENVPCASLALDH
ncbi:Fc receptor-like protein 3 isoform X4 [Prionailurus viverrinus]|uniref:Fc receptor-like protein 3 isoform X4 n=1 Tax=Prionailurus viverrinus TaxID=61388 RepID=UPI001FF405A4|nr:Fc receptor-like protein 3 isoform X4 [Prionailurus viverrinus]